MLQPSGKRSSVNLEAATGTMVLHFMLYFSPSIANVFANDNKPNLAKQ